MRPHRDVCLIADQPAFHVGNWAESKNHPHKKFIIPTQCGHGRIHYGRLVNAYSYLFVAGSSLYWCQIIRTRTLR